MEKSVEQIESEIDDLEHELEKALTERFREIVMSDVEQFLNRRMNHQCIEYAGKEYYRKLELVRYESADVGVWVLVTVSCYQENIHHTAQCLYHPRYSINAFEVKDSTRTALATLRAWELCASKDEYANEPDQAEGDTMRSAASLSAAALIAGGAGLVSGPIDNEPYKRVFGVYCDPFED